MSRSIRIAFLYVMFTTLYGTIGFMVVADYSFISALYMTIITITTVGYGEILELTDGGRIFTISLIVMGIASYGYGISVFSKFVFEENYYKNFKRKKQKKMFQKLNDHVIVCGYGRNGEEACTRLQKFKEVFVVIETDESKKEHFAEHYDPSYFYVGSAVDEDVLETVNIREAKALIAALPSDVNNLYIIMTARQLCPSINIVSRATEQSAVKNLKIAGADHVVMPDKIGGDHMASILVTPHIVEFIDNLLIKDAKHPFLREIEIKNKLDGRSIEDLNIRKNSGCNVIAYKEPNGKYRVNPDIKSRLQKNGTLIVIGNVKQIDELSEYF